MEDGYRQGSVLSTYKMLFGMECLSRYAFKRVAAERMIASSRMSRLFADDMTQISHHGEKPLVIMLETAKGTQTRKGTKQLFGVTLGLIKSKIITPTGTLTAAQYAADVGWRFLRQQVPVELRPQHRGKGVRNRVAGKEPAAGEHLEKDDSEGPQVGALVDAQAARLLR